ncbi:TetR/AcrR family transcriptional regulator [Streptomyces albofaciens JCM 4342]|uniref:TetR/AcrR family transcriptional regulator n=1 Tax=Streptomyces albofaciens TaxID=66866 RepID=UPI00123B21F3|nr:TetR/AcrR family transcriptional regulator [Streptomyces albofaciens]KAA6220840.1 TetR/AcrR family transcriptional regulator [Streptomyces albofaciens JCM 4342]
MDRTNAPGAPEQEDGGLRARLVTVGAELVAAEGVQALTLREIARRAGVSHGAPRRYFPTHLSLLSAIARRGFEELSEHLAAEADAQPQSNPRAQLLGMARAYLDFARTHPGMYELMFRHDLLESGHLGLRETSLPMFTTLVDLVARVRSRSEAGTRPTVGTWPTTDTRPTTDTYPSAEPQSVAGALWANLHGIAQLWSWGALQLATGAGDVEPLLRAALDAHLGPAPR